MAPSSDDSPVAIITGSASGIGLAVTKLLVSRGWRVMMADWNAELCSRESAALGPATAFLQCDVTSWEDQAAVFKATLARWGRLDLFAANAGVPEQVPLLFEKIEGDEPQKPSTLVVDVDYSGAIYGVSLALFYLRRNGGRGGKIVVTASQVGIHAWPYGPVYGGAKAACIHLVRCMAPGLAQENIFMNALCPGLTDTGITHGAIAQFPAEIITPMAYHMQAWERFLDAANVSGVIMEVDAAGLYERPPAEYWSPQHQNWLTDPESLARWANSGPLGASQVGK